MRIHRERGAHDCGDENDARGHVEHGDDDEGDGGKSVDAKWRPWVVVDRCDLQ